MIVVGFSHIRQQIHRDHEAGASAPDIGTRTPRSAATSVARS